jgi:hypothetical protein
MRGGWCHQCSNGLEWTMRSMTSPAIRGSLVPCTTAFTLRIPAMVSSTPEKGKSVPKKILSVTLYSCAVARIFQNCQGR